MMRDCVHRRKYHLKMQMRAPPVTSRSKLSEQWKLFYIAAISFLSISKKQSFP